VGDFEIRNRAEAVDAPDERGSPARRSVMHYAVLRPPFERLVAEAPPAVLTTPSMMPDNERHLLYNLARRYYRGAGRIVDAGIFLGGSTHCFAAGLRENPRLAIAQERWGKPVVSVERAVVSPIMPPVFARLGIGRRYEPGDSFADLLISMVKPHLDLVELRIGDITEIGDVNERIEILFLDVLKHRGIANYAISEYFPSLIPGRSMVIQQDYFFEGLPFIKICQEFFGPYFDYIGEAGSSAVFLCVEKPPMAEIRRLRKGLDPAEQLRLHAVAMQRSLDPWRRLLMVPSMVRLVLGLEGADAAADYLTSVEAEFCDDLGPGAPERIVAAFHAARRLCGLEAAA
jgi:hypothetical protein